MEDNSSFWEDDPHLEKHENTWLEYFDLTTDYLSLPLCFFALLSNILIIYTTLKYRRLKNRTNYYLLNFAIFHTLYILSTPILYVIMDIFFQGGLEISWFCTWIRIETFGMSLLLTFIGGYGVDVILEQRRPNWFRKYDERYFYLFSFFYFLHLMVYLISASICFKEAFRNNFNFHFSTIYYLLEVIFLLYLGIKTRYEHFYKTKSYALTISITILLLWLPFISIYNLLNVLEHRSTVMALWHVVFLPEYLAYSSSIIVCYQLWKHHKQYKTAFRKVFRRNVSFSDYEELFIIEGTRVIDDNDKI